MATSTRRTTRPSATGAGFGTVAVVAHGKKTLGGGLDELRARLAAPGVDELLWFEVTKSKKAPKWVREAVKAGADHNGFADIRFEFATCMLARAAAFLISAKAISSDGCTRNVLMRKFCKARHVCTP